MYGPRRGMKILDTENGMQRALLPVHTTMRGGYPKPMRGGIPIRGKMPILRGRGRMNEQGRMSMPSRMRGMLYPLPMRRDILGFCPAGGAIRDGYAANYY